MGIIELVFYLILMLVGFMLGFFGLLILLAIGDGHLLTDKEYKELRRKAGD